MSDCCLNVLPVLMILACKRLHVEFFVLMMALSQCGAEVCAIVVINSTLDNLYTASGLLTPKTISCHEASTV